MTELRATIFSRKVGINICDGNLFPGSDETASRERKGQSGQVPLMPCIWVAANITTSIFVPVINVDNERTYGYID
jgi:hypothetical protein